METKGKVVIAIKEKHSVKLEQLRWISYHNSQSFEVVDDEVFQSHCKWTDRDSSGIVLLALDNENIPLATMRGNIFYNQDELDIDINFRNNSDEFISFPTLNMTFAATSPLVFKNGLNSVLRYYFYFLHRHCVKSILGTAVFNSSIYKTLEKLNYEFRFIDALRKDLLDNDRRIIAKLENHNFDKAIKTTYDKYLSAIKQFPLIID